MQGYCYKLFPKPLFARKNKKKTSSECHTASGHNVNLSRKRAPHHHTGVQLHTQHTAQGCCLPSPLCLQVTASTKQLLSERSSQGSSSTRSAAHKQSHEHRLHTGCTDLQLSPPSGSRPYVVSPKFCYLLLLWLSKLSANMKSSKKKSSEPLEGNNTYVIMFLL